MPAKPKKTTLWLPWEIDKWLSMQALRERRTRTAIILLSLENYRRSQERIKRSKLNVGT